MRLTKEVTEELVKEVAGEDTVKLVGLLKEKENISEFKLAEKLRITVNTVRNMLYRLQAHNLVTSIRKKDKKKGWYIYYWTFNTPQARSLIRIVKRRKLEKIKERLRTEIQETFYVCPERCTRFKMENAMEYDFKCPECGHILQEEDNLEFITKLKTTMAELEEELSKPIIESRVKSKIKSVKPKIKKSGRGRPKLAKRGRPKLAKRGRPKLAKRGRPKIKKIKPKKVRLVKVKKLKTNKPKLKAKKIKKLKTKRKMPKKRAKQKKRSALKRVRRFLKHRK